MYLPRKKKLEIDEGDLKLNTKKHLKNYNKHLKIPTKFKESEEEQYLKEELVTERII